MNASFIRFQMIWLSIQHFTVKNSNDSQNPAAVIRTLKYTITFKRPITFPLRITTTSAAGRFCDLEAEIPLHRFSFNNLYSHCQLQCTVQMSPFYGQSQHPLHNTMMACCPITYNRQKRSYPRIFSTTQRGIWTHPSKLSIEDVKYLLLITWPEIESRIIIMDKLVPLASVILLLFIWQNLTQL